MRSARQRKLKSELSDLGAASVRFLYALPFALVWLALVAYFPGSTLPTVNSDFAPWSVSRLRGVDLLVHGVHPDARGLCPRSGANRTDLYLSGLRILFPGESQSD